MNLKNKTVIGLILGYTATIGGSAAFGYWAYGQYTEARDEEATVQKQVEVAKIKIERIEDLEVDVICLRENLSEAAKILPDDAEVNEFVNKLNDFADESGSLVRELTDEKDRSRSKDTFDKVIYKVALRANVDQFLSFLALAEGWERFVKVTSIDLKGGEWSEGMPREDVRHEVTVSLQTYAYRSQDDSKTVQIQNYDTRKLQLREEILARRAEIQVERYNFIPNALRRDMFIDPRVRVTEDGEGGLPIAEQRQMVDGMVVEASTLAQMDQQARQSDTNFLRKLELQTEIDKRVDVLSGALERVIQERQVTDMTQRRRLDNEVKPVVQLLVDRDGNNPKPPTNEELRQVLTAMAVLMDGEDYKGALKRYQTLESRVSPEILDYDGVALLNEMQAAATLAEIAIEFGEIAIEIGGAVVADSGGSVAIINDRVLQEGDALADGLVIHRIAPDRIEFRYRGVTLIRAR